MSRFSGGRASTDSPRMKISPRVGRSKPAISIRVVVLPEPLGPRIVRNSPSAMSSDRSFSATTPAPLRSEPIRVLSTPDMIRLIEQTAIEAVAPCLAPGQATVGTRVDVAHLAATPVGMTVTITVELVEIDRRRLGFRVAVRDE